MCCQDPLLAPPSDPTPSSHHPPRCALLLLLLPEQQPPQRRAPYSPPLGAALMSSHTRLLYPPSLHGSRQRRVGNHGGSPLDGLLLVWLKETIQGGGGWIRRWRSSSTTFPHCRRCREPTIHGVHEGPAPRSPPGA